MEPAHADETRTDLASIGSRFLALLIDGVLLGIVGGLLFRSSRGVGGVVGFLLGVTYQWYFLTRHRGQTPGKMLLGIRVVKSDGAPLSDADAVLRYVGYVINSAVIMLGWIWALFDANRQGWHDKIARTYVVRAQTPTADAP